MRFLFCSVSLSVALFGCGSSQQKTSEIKVENSSEVDSKILGHVVHITAANPSNGIIWNCTGSLVTTRHVLTAAHCLEDATKDTKFVVSFNRDVSEKTKEKPVMILVSKTRVHSKFNPKFLEERTKVAENNFAKIQSLGAQFIASEFITDPALKIAAQNQLGKDFDDMMRKGEEAENNIEVNDIALLTLSKEAPKTHAPATVAGETSKISAGAQLLFGGFGITNLEAHFENEAARQEYEKAVKEGRGADPQLKFQEKDEGGGVLLGAKFSYTSPTKNHIFFAAPKKNENGKFAQVTPGDSGGAIYATSPKTGAAVVVGVASFIMPAQLGGGWFVDIRPYSKTISAWVDEDLKK